MFMNSILSWTKPRNAKKLPQWLLVTFSQTTEQVALRRNNGVIVTLHVSPAHHVPIWFWLGGVETVSKQHIFIMFYFSEVKTSPNQQPSCRQVRFRPHL